MKNNILIVGPIGAGKSTLASSLLADGWQVVSTSTILKKHYTKINGDTPTRKQLQKAGIDLIANRGENYIAKLIFSEFKNNTMIAIEGVRTPGIATALKDIIPDLYIVYVDAPREIRLQRVTIRDTITSEEFHEFESSPIEIQVPNLQYLSEIKIDNSGAIETAICQLHQEIKEE